MAVINFPDPAGQTPLNTFSPTSTPSATSNGVTYLWTDGSWSIQASSSGGGGGGIEEAPVDGKQYGREDAGWTEITGGGGGGFSGDYDDLTNKPDIPDSTNDLTNDSGFITAADVPSDTDELPEGSTNKYFEEANLDGKQYARQNGQWKEVVATGGGDDDLDIVPKVRQVFTATAGQTVFALSGDDEFTDGTEQVFRNGSLLALTTDYTTSGNNTVTLAMPAFADDVVEIYCINALPTDDIKYTYPGGEEQSLQERLTQVISVKDFGAKGDGSTDDADAFRKAIGNSATPKSIFIPPGTYVIKSTIELPVNGDLTQKGFYGQYPATTIIYEGTDELFKVPGGNVIFDGIIFSTNEASGDADDRETYTKTAIFDMKEMDNRPTYIQNCRFNKFGTAIKGNSNLANIRNNQFTSNKICIDADGPLMNSSIVGNSMSFNNRGIVLIKADKEGSVQSEGLRILDNTIQGSNPSITFACGLEMLISGNILDQTAEGDKTSTPDETSAILIDAGLDGNAPNTTVSALKILHNYILCGTGAQSCGIRIKNAGTDMNPIEIQDILIKGNTFNAGSPYDACAINCGDAKSINISDNFFVANWISAARWNVAPYYGAPVILDDAEVNRVFISNNNFSYGNPVWMQGTRSMAYRATFDGSATSPTYGWDGSSLGMKKDSGGLILSGSDNGTNLSFGVFDPNDAGKPTMNYGKGSVYIRDFVGIYVKTDVDVDNPWEILAP